MPIKLNVYNQKAEVVSEIELADKIFGLRPNLPLIHQVVVAQLANQRQVLAHTKDRSEVRGGGRKPWRQKGTGRARAGSSRSPLWIGGGVVFGPTKNRNFKKKINRKMRQNALFMTLTDKIQNHQLVILDKLETNEFKTKLMAELITALENKLFIPAIDQKKVNANKISETEKVKKASTKIKTGKRSILLISDNMDEKVKYSLRNLAGSKVLNLENINILDLLKYKNLILTKSAAEHLEKKYQK